MRSRGEEAMEKVGGIQCRDFKEREVPKMFAYPAHSAKNLKGLNFPLRRAGFLALITRNN